MSLKEIPIFCLYLHQLLEYMESFQIFDQANEFILNAIDKYQFQFPPNNIQDFRALVIREGKENSTTSVQHFFYQLHNLKAQKK